MMSELRNQQVKFAKMLPLLIAHAFAIGYDVTLGDAYRDSRLHGDLGVKKGYGAANSFHKKRLAIDLNLFRNGVLLESTDDHKPLGEYWESIGGTWGGRFKDGNHYSLGEKS
jgi:D-alanyl-D-alanine carboxypeptidase